MRSLSTLTVPTNCGCKPEIGRCRCTREAAQGPAGAFHREACEVRSVETLNAHPIPSSNQAPTMLKPVSFLALIGMSAAFAPSLAPLRSSRSATSPRLAAVSGLRIARSSGSFPTFLPKEMVDPPYLQSPLDHSPIHTTFPYLPPLSTGFRSSQVKYLHRLANPDLYPGHSPDDLVPRRWLVPRPASLFTQTNLPHARASSEPDALLIILPSEVFPKP